MQFQELTLVAMERGSHVQNDVGADLTGPPNCRTENLRPQGGTILQTSLSAAVYIDFGGLTRGTAMTIL